MGLGLRLRLRVGASLSHNAKSSIHDSKLFNNIVYSFAITILLSMARVRADHSVNFGIDRTRLTRRLLGRDYRLTDVYGSVVKEILV